MKHDPTKRRARRGFLIIAGLLLTAALVFNIDVIVDAFRSYVEVVALVRESSGVQVGSPVWVDGVEAGRVTGVAFTELNGRPAVAVDLRLEDRVRTVVRTNSRAHTMRQRVIGAPTLQISAGRAGSRPIEPGDTLYPADRPSVDSLIEGAKAFAPAVDSLNSTLGELERLAADRVPRLEGLVDRLAVVSDEAGILRAELDEGTIGRWLRDPSVGSRFERLRIRLAGLSETADRLQRYGDPELRGSVASVGVRARELGGALDELERRLTDGQGVLGRMERDTAIDVAIEGVQAQIDSLRAAGMGFVVRMFVP